MSIVGDHGLAARRFLHLRVPMREGLQVRNRTPFTTRLSLSEALLRIPVRLDIGRAGSLDLYVDDDQLRELQRYPWRREHQGDFVLSIDPDSGRQVMLSEIILRDERTGRLGPRLTAAQAAEAGLNYHSANLRRILGVERPAPTSTEIPVYAVLRPQSTPDISPEEFQSMTQMQQLFHIAQRSSPLPDEPTTSSSEPMYFVQVDPRDISRVRQYRWRVRQQSNSAPYTIIERRPVTLGAFILSNEEERVYQHEPGHDFRRANLYIGRTPSTRERMARASHLRSAMQAVIPSPTTEIAYVPSTNGWTMIVDADMEDIARRYHWAVRSIERKITAVRQVLGTSSRGNRISRRVYLERAIVGLQNPETGVSLGSDVLFLDESPDLNRRIIDLRRSNIRRTSDRTIRAVYGKRRRGTGAEGTPTSRYHGVAWEKKARKWRARITIPRQGDTPSKTYRLGYYESEVEAAQVRDREVIRHRLDILRGVPLNFPRSHYGSGNG